MEILNCPQCGTGNPTAMAFCSNCGQPLSPQNGKFAEINPYEIPPTVLSSQPEFASSAGNAPASYSFPPTEQPIASATKKSSKGLLFGLLGCGGLLVLSLIGLVIVLKETGTMPVHLFSRNSTFPQNEVNANKSSSNSTPASNNNPVSTKLLSDMQALKQVGVFKLGSVKVVDITYYYPRAEAAVQSAYTDDLHVVTSITIKFPSSQAAKDDFNAHMKSITSDGATILTKESENGVDSSTYKYKDDYHIEVCAQGTCSRNYSNDAKALQTFAKSYGAAFKEASKTSSPTQNTTPTTTETKTISGGVVNDKASNLVTPTYPAAAKAVHASGAVNVQVTIDTAGNVASASATSGHPLLKQAAEQAARASKFKPTVLNGQPVNVTGIITYNFQAQ